MTWPHLDLPSIGFLTLFAIGGVWLCWLFLRRRSELQQATKRLDEFKSQVVQYSDRLDQLCERHKMLPYLDPDYTTPMVGETARVYEQVQQALQSHRDRWLAMMDVWDATQKQLTQNSLATQQREVLDRRLQDAGLAQALSELERQCQTPLDQLEQAHETARNQESDLKAVQAKIGETQRRLATQLWPVDSTVAPGKEITDLLEAASLRLEADPLGAQLVLSDARRRADQELGRLQLAETLWERRNQLEQSLDELEKVIQRKRGEGFSFAEPEGDPAPLVRDGRRHLQSAVPELKAGDPELAAPSLEAAGTAIERGRHVVEFQEKMQAFCSDEMHRLTALLRALQDELPDVQRQQEQMSRQFAATSWILVADNLEQARGGLDRWQSLLSRVGDCLAPQRQAYFQANRLLEEVRRGIDHVRGLIAAIAQRWQELQQLRTAARGELAELRSRQQSLARQLGSSSVDRPRSNYRFQQTAQLIEGLSAEADAATVDWPQLRTRAVQAANDLNLVAQMMQEDYDLEEQARREVDEARQAIRRAGGYYRHGVRPSTQQAHQLLDEAQQRLQQQEYEQAIAQANHAEQAAYAARHTAEEQSRSIQRDLYRRQGDETVIQVGAILEKAATAAIRALQRTRY